MKQRRITAALLCVILLLSQCNFKIQAASPVTQRQVEAQLAAQILPDLFYPPRMSREWAAAARENQRGREALWALGIPPSPHIRSS